MPASVYIAEDAAEAGPIANPGTIASPIAGSGTCCIGYCRTIAEAGACPAGADAVACRIKRCPAGRIAPYIVSIIAVCACMGRSGVGA